MYVVGREQNTQEDLILKENTLHLPQTLKLNKNTEQVHPHDYIHEELKCWCFPRGVRLALKREERKHILFGPVCLAWDALSFLQKEWRRVNLGWSGVRVGLEGVKTGETVVGMYGRREDYSQKLNQVSHVLSRFM